MSHDSTPNNVSRRKLLKNGSAASLGLLFTHRFAFAQDTAPQTAKKSGFVPKPFGPHGPVGMDLKLTAVTPHMLRISIAAVEEELDTYYEDGAIAPRKFAKPMLRQRTDAAAYDVQWGNYSINIEPSPLTITVRHPQGSDIQTLTFHPERNQINFTYANAPVYGLGPGTHPLERRGTKDMMRNGAGDNLRVFGARNPIPWLMGKGWGLYIHEPGGQFDLTGDLGMFRPSDVARGQDMYLVVADTPAELLHQYAELTGYPHLPAKWTLGFQQSHRTLDSRQQIIDEAKTFREKKLPCDTVIYLGTGFCPSGWNTGHGSFVYNETVFPDPDKVLKEFHDMHFNVVLHVVNPPETLHGQVSDTGSAAAVPGNAANYWAQHKPFVKAGIDGWWPDEGDVLPTPSRLVRNRMYWEGGRKTRPDRRPFALHRNCFAGIQRWGWLWSGDTTSTWLTLQTQIMEGINAGLNGVPYWGTDIGGFVPTKEFTAEMFVRWFQFGAFCPSFRCHGRTWQLRRPWGWDTGSYGPSEMGPNAASFLPKESDLHNAAIEPICRKFLNLRYQLLPYLYSSAYETHKTGLPIIRSLGLSFPDDAKAWETVDAYLWGANMLVAPIYEKDATKRKVTLPNTTWFNYWTNERINGNTTVTLEAPLDSMPLLVKAGAIIPSGPVKQWAYEPSTEPITLTVYPGADGKFTYYDDDGLTFAFEHNDYAAVDLSWNDSNRTLTLTRNGGTRTHPLHFSIGLAGGQSKSATLTHTPVHVQL